MGTVFHRGRGYSAALHRFNSYIWVERTRIAVILGLGLIGPAVALALWVLWWGT